MNCPICSRCLLTHELCRSDPAHLAAILRYRLALAIIALFGAVALAAIVAPDRPVLRELLPFVATLLVTVLRPYFGPPINA